MSVESAKGRVWEDKHANLNALLKACGTYHFGPNPASRYDEMRVSKAFYGSEKVMDRLPLLDTDVVLDMGSGCGFIAGYIAPKVQRLYCADLNSQFLDLCRKEVEQFAHVSCHLISFADFSSLKGCGINKVYSTAVWIHFNFFDMVLNLRALNKILPVGGRIYFDYADPDGLDESNDMRIFNMHLKDYAEARETIALRVQYNSEEAVRSAAQLSGFVVDEVKKISDEDYGAVLTKRANWVE